MSEPVWLWSLRLAVRSWWRRHVTYRGRRTHACDSCLDVQPRSTMRIARLRDGSLTWECAPCATVRTMLKSLAAGGWKPDA
jgi:hypothetical protein